MAKSKAAVKSRKKATPKRRGGGGKKRALPKSVADLRSDPKNPRWMTERAARGLRGSLKEFGDVSGIVWNRRTGALVAGHQRVARLRELHGDLLKIDLDGPDGPAVVCPDGERFRIRVVDWDQKKALAANVAANSEAIAGQFDDLALQTILSDMKDGDARRFEEINMADLVKGVSGKGKKPPDEFPNLDGDLDTDYKCPHCGYEWSGKKS